MRPFHTQQLLLGIWLVASIIGILLLSTLSRSLNPLKLPTSLKFIRLSEHLTRKSLNESHVFIPADHNRLHFVGRWIWTTARSRYDAAFPGSYVEFSVLNTTSIFCDLNNQPADQSRQKRTSNPVTDTQRVFLLPESDNRHRSDPTSLLVEIDAKHVYGYEAASGIISIASDLNPHEPHRVRITHLGEIANKQSTLQFNGIWIGSGSNPRRDTNITPGSNLSGPHVLPGIFPDQDHNLIDREHGITTRGGHKQTRKFIEIGTSETSLSAFSAGENPLTSHSRLETWTNHLSKLLSLDVSLIPTSQIGALRSETSTTATTTIQDLFFRSGPPTSSPQHSLRPWSFASSQQPSILILQLGLTDFGTFLESPSTQNHNSHDHHALNKLKVDFISSLVKLIHTIRRAAYPYKQDETTDSTDPESKHKHKHRYGHSYIYASAPSVVPIMLLAPWSSVLIRVSGTVTLHEVISECLSQAASVVYSEGDISTIWIDTAGWVDGEDDFVTWRGRVTGGTEADNNVDCNSTTSPVDRILTPTASARVASFLSLHLCPHLHRSTLYHSAEQQDDRPATATDSDDQVQCQSRRYQRYVGKLYVPDEVDVERRMLERKIALIRTGIAGGRLSGVADWSSGEG